MVYVEYQECYYINLLFPGFSCHQESPILLIFIHLQTLSHPFFISSPARKHGLFMLAKRLSILFSVAHSLFPWHIRAQHFARYAFFFSSHHVSVSVRHPLYVISFGSIRHSRCPSDVIHPGIIVACHVASSSRLTVSVFPVASL